MVYYSSSNEYILNFIYTFCKTTASEKINISKVENFISDNDNVFFIPVYGEEELSVEWEFFLKKYTKNLNNIGVNTFFYLYGVYDIEIDKNTTIIKQINNILKFLSTQINIFPLKIMPNYTPVETLVYYYNHTYNKKVNDNFLIDKIIFSSKQKLIQNNSKTVDFTAKTDGYSSVIDTIKLKKKEKRKFLTQVISSLTCETVMLNRVKNINIDKVLKKTQNNKILKLQLKSNRLENIVSLSGFSSLEVLNLTANSFNMINIEDLTTTIKSLNISKNYIKKVKIKKTRLKIKKLILFNNKITDMSFLKNFPNLVYLNVGLNPIEEFPNAILNLNKLEHLNMSFVNIGRMPNKILELKQLKSIDITGSKILNYSDLFIKLQQNGVKVIS
jgi:hypothetical protein